MRPRKIPLHSLLLRRNFRVAVPSKIPIHRIGNLMFSLEVYPGSFHTRTTHTQQSTEKLLRGFAGYGVTTEEIILYVFKFFFEILLRGFAGYTVTTEKILSIKSVIPGYYLFTVMKRVRLPAVKKV